MTTHIMKLSKTPFDKIKNGTKIIESRLYDEKRRLINLGDEIEFLENNNPNNKILADVVGLLNYKNFNDLFNDFDAKMFGGLNTAELLNEIGQFYSLEEQKINGVLGIKIILK